MKIRILANSIRLRLSQLEVKEFHEKGLVEETTHFGPNNEFRYALEKYDKENITAQFQDHKITIFLPISTARDWAISDQISLRNTLETTDSQMLSILVEKDFKCLKPREGEDETDLFPNPDDEKC